MSQPSIPDENNGLRARNLELEEQLAAAGREADVQDEVETALRATLLYLENIVDTVRERMLVLDRVLLQTPGPRHRATHYRLLTTAAAFKRPSPVATSGHDSPECHPSGADRIVSS